MKKSLSKSQRDHVLQIFPQEKRIFHTRRMKALVRVHFAEELINEAYGFLGFSVHYKLDFSKISMNVFFHFIIAIQ
jgi:hypothetical protein